MSSLLLALWSVVVVVCDRGLQSLAGLLMVVVVEQPGPWCSIVIRGGQDRGLVDSGSWVQVPLWWVGVGVTARGGQVPPGSVPTS